MAARNVTVKHERKGLSHVTVYGWDSDAGDMADLYAGSIDGGEWHCKTGAHLSDEERAAAMTVYLAAQ